MTDYKMTLVTWRAWTNPVTGEVERHKEETPIRFRPSADFVRRAMQRAYAQAYAMARRNGKAHDDCVIAAINEIRYQCADLEVLEAHRVRRRRE